MKTIHLIRKPCSEGSVGLNVLNHGGTGGLNIDHCRIATDEDIRTHSRGKGYDGHAFHRMNPKPERKQPGQELGRYPTNVVLHGSASVRNWGEIHVDVQDKPILRFFKVI